MNTTATLQALQREPDSPETTYIFFRGEWFYMVHFKNDDDARANAECNPGTTRVADFHNRTVWLP